VGTSEGIGIVVGAGLQLMDAAKNIIARKIPKRHPIIFIIFFPELMGGKRFVH
jgi:hypothetical protein